VPPSCPGAPSGACRTAQRTSRNNATTGILRKTINQMNVQMSTRPDRIPEAASAQPCPCPPCPARTGNGPSGPELQGGAAKLRHRVQFLDPRDDLPSGQALHALGPE